MSTATLTGPIRIDALAGHAPRWRPDANECPVYDQLVSELGPPGLLVGPGQVVHAAADAAADEWLAVTGVVLAALDSDDETGDPS